MKKLGMSVLLVLFFTSSGWATILTNEYDPPAKMPPVAVGKLPGTDPLTATFDAKFADLITGDSVQLVMAIMADITSTSFDFFSEIKRVHGANGAGIGNGHGNGSGNGNGHGNGHANGNGHGPNDNPVAPVPEPGTLLLLGVGLIGFVGFRKLKKFA